MVAYNVIAVVVLSLGLFIGVFAGFKAMIDAGFVEIENERIHSSFVDRRRFFYTGWRGIHWFYPIGVKLVHYSVGYMLMMGSLWGIADGFAELFHFFL